MTLRVHIDGTGTYPAGVSTNKGLTPEQTVFQIGAWLAQGDVAVIVVVPDA